MEITFLTKQQALGNILGIGQLQVMKDYGTRAGMSDLAIILGGTVSAGTMTQDGQPSGEIWSSTIYDFLAGGVTSEGDYEYYGLTRRNVGARPVLPATVTSSIKPGEVWHTRKIGDVQVVEYGEYPQTIVAEALNKELEQAFWGGQLQATGKLYTFDGKSFDAYGTPFNAKEYAEFQHHGKKYIRMEANLSCSVAALSNNRTPQAGEACWIEVQPIEWLKDPSGAWVARQALFSGIQFDGRERYDGNFADTNMKRYLDHYFSKDMMPSRTVDAPAVVGPRTAAVAKGRELQRERALRDPSQGL